MTRADTAIYVQALQRRGHKPRAVDLRRLNLVVKYLKRHRVSLFYGKVKKPWRITGFSDAAFKAQNEDSSGLCIRGLAVLLTTDDSESAASPDGNVNLVEFLVRRLKRVVRSTYSAELNALLDSVENILLLQLALHQILHGTAEGTETMLLRLALLKL